MTWDRVEETSQADVIDYRDFRCYFFNFAPRTRHYGRDKLLHPDHRCGNHSLRVSSIHNHDCPVFGSTLLTSESSVLHLPKFSVRWSLLLITCSERRENQTHLILEFALRIGRWLLPCNSSNPSQKESGHPSQLPRFLLFLTGGGGSCPSPTRPRIPKSFRPFTT